MRHFLSILVILLVPSLLLHGCSKTNQPASSALGKESAEGVKVPLRESNEVLSMPKPDPDPLEKELLDPRKAEALNRAIELKLAPRPVWIHKTSLGTILTHTNVGCADLKHARDKGYEVQRFRQVKSDDNLYGVIVDDNGAGLFWKDLPVFDCTGCRRY